MKWSEREGLEILAQDPKITHLRNCPNFNPEKDLYKAAGDVKGSYELRTGHISYYGQVIPTCVMSHCPKIKCGYLVKHLFGLYPGRVQYLPFFVYWGMYATFWGLKLPLKVIFCLQFATWISHFGSKFSATANFWGSVLYINTSK